MKRLLATALVLLAASGVVVLLRSDNAVHRSATTHTITGRAHRRSPLAARPVSHPLAQPLVPSRSRSLRAPDVPLAAIGISDQYAIASYTTFAGAAADSWIAAVAPLCTARWRAALLAAQHTAGASSATYEPTVVRNYPSHAPSGSVAVTVQLSGVGGRSGPTLYVVLVERDGHYLVDGAQ